MTSITLEPRPGADPTDGKETETLTGEATRRIRQSILDPDAVIAAGYAKGIMPPNFGKLLSTPQVDALVNYLEKVAAQ